MENIKEEDFIKICAYRNCGKVIPDTMRKDAKYCCRNHKVYEKKYIRRKEVLLQKYKQIGLEKAKAWKEFKEIVKGEIQN